MRLLGYWPADFVFAFGVAMMFAVLWFLHLRGQINLVDCLTATDRNNIVRTDARKLVESPVVFSGGGLKIGNGCHNRNDPESRQLLKPCLE